MSRYTGPACKLCRRRKEKLFLKGEKCFVHCVLDRQSDTPRKTRVTRRSKLSEYSIRLREKQKLRIMVGMSETSFSKFFRHAERMPGTTGDTLLQLLEMRLDNVVKRIGYATSPRAARQLVFHGHVRVNGRSVYIPSYVVRPGDTLELRPALLENVGVKRSMEAAQRRGTCPVWVEFQPQSMKAKVLRAPTREEISFPVQEQLIVEHYSK